MKVEKSINVTGACCPMPIIELAEAMKSLMPGQCIEITGNDPVFERGMRDYCKARGHHILGIQIHSSSITVTIQK